MLRNCFNFHYDFEKATPISFNGYRCLWYAEDDYSKYLIMTFSDNYKNSFRQFFIPKFYPYDVIIDIVSKFDRIDPFGNTKFLHEFFNVYLDYIDGEIHILQGGIKIEDKKKNVDKEDD